MNFNSYNQFIDETDPFNPSNMLTGFICTESNNKYGALLITSINGVETNQLIYCTPKIKYPIDRFGRYIFPPANLVTTYEKIDGTNIFMYRYEHEGKSYVSYKTRMTPFVRNGKFGAFRDMWKSMMVKYPNMESLFENNHDMIDGFSFELYGFANTHLIKYDVPIDTVLLFGVDYDGNITPPHDIVVDGSVPVLPVRNEFDNKADFISMYGRSQEKMETTINKLENSLYEGMEGEIWYVETDTDTVMFKCKPFTIAEIHWAMSSIITADSIKTTILNSLEATTGNKIDVEYVKQLLAEEYSDELIDASEKRIMNCIKVIQEEMELSSAIDDCIEDLSIDIVNMDIPTIMRLLSKRFNRNDMRGVYNIVERKKNISQV